MNKTVVDGALFMAFTMFNRYHTSDIAAQLITIVFKSFYFSGIYDVPAVFL